MSFSPFNSGWNQEANWNWYVAVLQQLQRQCLLHELGGGKVSCDTQGFEFQCSNPFFASFLNPALVWRKIDQTHDSCDTISLWLGQQSSNQSGWELFSGQELSGLLDVTEAPGWHEAHTKTASQWKCAQQKVSYVSFSIQIMILHTELGEWFDPTGTCTFASLPRKRVAMHLSQQRARCTKIPLARSIPPWLPCRSKAGPEGTYGKEAPSQVSKCFKYIPQKFGSTKGLSWIVWAVLKIFAGRSLSDLGNQLAIGPIANNGIGVFFR